MKAPLSWLRSYVDLPADAQIVADRLATLGFPVEHIEIPPTVTGVVFGRIIKLEPHPNADRLQVCTIDIGGPQTLTIATAATNVAENQVVPVAQIGAQLPELKIAPRKMRGIDSEGMLCSAAELGLPAAWFEDGILQCDQTMQLGADVIAVLGLAEPVLEIEVTTNRPDALSLLGIARELSAAYAVPLRMPESTGLAALPERTALSVRLETPDAERFYALDVSGFTLGVAPILMRTRLARAGVRPIDALVDITNYVMLEFGRPMHFFDAAAITDATLIVRDAAAGEKLTTLDGVQRELQPTQAVVADTRQALALAGVFGGQNSGIRPQTSRAILEAAHFRGARIRRSAAAAGLRTEASSRFEKGLAVAMLEPAVERAVFLLQSIGARVASPVVAGEALPPAAPVRFDPASVERILGIAISTEQSIAYLEHLGCVVTRAEKMLNVIAPPWRTDLHIDADFVEEIARVHGYDKLGTDVAAVHAPTVSSASYIQERNIALALQQAGFNEIVTLALESQGVRARFAAAGCEPDLPSLEIRNPLSEEQRYLRFSLLPAMLELVARRQNELREHELYFYEIGSIFGDGAPPHEERVLLFAGARKRQPETANFSWRDEFFYSAKGRAEHVLRALFDRVPEATAGHLRGMHPGKSAILRIGEKTALTIGVLDPRLAAAYDIEADVVIGFAQIDALPQPLLPRYVTPSRYPGVSRDLAFVLERSIPAARVLSVLTAAEPNARDARVFDEYHGPTLGDASKSLTVRFVLQHADATLTDEDAEASVQRIIAALKRECNAELRR